MKICNFKIKYSATLTYIISVVLINVLFVYIPLISIGTTTMTPADIIAGSIYVFRDFAQREIKHYIIFAMLIACLLSYLLASQAIAIASFAAFATAEMLDWAIFTFTRKPLSERLLWSALISSPVDSAVFCHFMPNLHWLDFSVTTFAKFMGVFIIWIVWKTRSPQQVAKSFVS